MGRARDLTMGTGRPKRQKSPRQIKHDELARLTQQAHPDTDRLRELIVDVGSEPVQPTFREVRIYALACVRYHALTGEVLGPTGVGEY